MAGRFLVATKTQNGTFVVVDRQPTLEEAVERGRELAKHQTAPIAVFTRTDKGYQMEVTVADLSDSDSRRDDPEPPPTAA